VICPLAVIPLSFVSVGYFTFREFICLHSITKAFEPSCFIAFSKAYAARFSWRLRIPRTPSPDNAKRLPIGAKGQRSTTADFFRVSQQRASPKVSRTAESLMPTTAPAPSTIPSTKTMTALTKAAKSFSLGRELVEGI
jgi:hypothetical protein